MVADVCLQAPHVYVSNRDVGEGKGTFEVFIDAGHDVQQGGPAGAVIACEADSFASRDGETDAVKRGFLCIRETVAQVFHLEGNAVTAIELFEGDAFLPFNGDVRQAAEFFQRGHHVIDYLNCEDDFLHGGHDEDDDDFSCHELAEVDLVVDDQEAADDEQQGSDSDLEGDNGAVLGDEDPEVAFAGIQVAADQVISALQGQVAAACQLEGSHGAGQFFQPVGDFVLVF